MQSCVSASRDSLGDSWLPAYLAAPIWRYWLGAGICGATVVGAFMSSLDGMGRYYPLTLLACADSGDAIAPPDIDAHDEWFAAVENFLLSTLDNTVSFEAITNSLDQLRAPMPQSADPPVEVSVLGNGVIASPLGNRSFSDLFALLRAANHSSIYAAASFWWTAGGGDYEPCGFCCQNMPDPMLFTSMLTGRIDSAVG